MATIIPDDRIWFWAYRIVAGLLAFIGGIATAGFTLGRKFGGWEERLKAVEEFNIKVDSKLDKIHERISDHIEKER